jgi:signal transduction histidine kinase
VKWRSLRVSFLVGSILWTMGLLAASHMFFVYFTQYFPHVLVIRHWTILGGIALIFMLGGLTQVRRGLSPINQLRKKLSQIRDGRDARLEGSYPSEVQPLIDDLNTLLADKDQRVRRAMAKAGDLAHGLKTPLAVLTQEAGRARAEGHGDLAAAIEQQVDRMRRQMDYHLAHARASASGATLGARASVQASADGLARTLLRLHADRGLEIAVDVADALHVRVQREDLDEILGNLLDNACKWAKSRVRVSASLDASGVTLLVDDDGPGLDRSMWDRVLQRGVRADEAAPGSGFGLAIVCDLVDVYGGSIGLGASPEGGLRATVVLPGA